MFQPISTALSGCRHETIHAHLSSTQGSEVTSSVKRLDSARGQPAETHVERRVGRSCITADSSFLPHGRSQLLKFSCFLALVFGLDDVFRPRPTGDSCSGKFEGLSLLFCPTSMLTHNCTNTTLTHVISP